eukprot:965056-Prymnesium_polylepis.2
MSPAPRAGCSAYGRGADTALQCAARTPVTEPCFVWLVCGAVTGAGCTSARAESSGRCLIKSQ